VQPAVPVLLNVCFFVLSDHVVHPVIARVVSDVSSDVDGQGTCFASSASSVNRGRPRRVPFDDDGCGDVLVVEVESLSSIIFGPFWIDGGSCCDGHFMRSIFWWLVRVQSGDITNRKVIGRFTDFSSCCLDYGSSRPPSVSPPHVSSTLSSTLTLRQTAVALPFAPDANLPASRCRETSLQGVVVVAGGRGRRQSSLQAFQGVVVAEGPFVASAANTYMYNCRASWTFRNVQ
jgi:hypothetical protein